MRSCDISFSLISSIASKSLLWAKLRLSLTKLRNIAFRSRFTRNYINNVFSFGQNNVHTLKCVFFYILSSTFPVP